MAAQLHDGWCTPLRTLLARMGSTSQNIVGVLPCDSVVHSVANEQLRRVTDNGRIRRNGNAEGPRHVPCLLCCHDYVVRSQRSGSIRTSTRREWSLRIRGPSSSVEPLGLPPRAYLYSIVVPVRATAGHLELKNGSGRKCEETVRGVLDPGLLQLQQKRMSGRVHLWWQWWWWWWSTHRGTRCFRQLGL